MTLVKGVLLTPEECARIAPALARHAQALRARGYQVDPVVEEIVAVGGAWIASHTEPGTPGIPGHSSDDGAGSMEPMTTRQVAELLGCTARNVTALAGRGALPGRRRSTGWTFEQADVVAYVRRSRGQS